MRFRLAYREYRQKCSIRFHDGHVSIEYHERVADRIDNALSQLPGALAIVPGCALLTDIVDSEQYGATLSTPDNFPSVDEHRSVADDRKIMLDFESLNRLAIGDYIFE